MQIIIENDIPIPKRGSVGEIDYVSVIHGMKKGDSILVPYAKRSGAISAFRRLDISCTTRVIDDDLVRIWRTE